MLKTLLGQFIKHNQARINCQKHLLKNMLLGVLFEEFLDYTDVGGHTSIPQLSIANAKGLKEKFDLKLPANCTLGELANILEERDDFDGNVYQGFVDALTDAEITGAVNDCTSDFDMEMRSAFGEGNWKITEDEVTLKMDKETIIDFVLTGWEENEGDYDEALSTYLKTIEFNFHEPYGGWGGLDEEYFNECLANNLLYA